LRLIRTQQEKKKQSIMPSDEKDEAKTPATDATAAINTESQPSTKETDEQPKEEAKEKQSDGENNEVPPDVLTKTESSIVDEAELKAEARIKEKKASAELTKRLQQLALDRQKTSTGERLKVIQSDHASHLSSAKTFQELNLPQELLDAIFAMGFDRPSAIQEEALPRILANPPRNLIGQAQSGSGKTAAFTLGMLYRIKVDSPATCQALCVTPTRELAIQIVDKAIKPMAANMKGMKIQLAIAGTFLDKTVGLDSHLVVGTPGKVVDWLKRRYINAKTIKVFVLDEADNMVEENGFRANSLLIKKQMPKNCQCLLFSATFTPEVVKFASKMVNNPDKILIEDGPEFLVLDVIKQLWIDTRSYDGGKLEFLADIYSLLTIGQSIVFVETKNQADMVHTTLSNAGYTCSVLHGGIEPAQRDVTMDAFRNGESTVLITTNVLARGVDVDNVCLVVNYDVPIDKDRNPDFETYLHRIGRTGRFGRKGTAINLIGDQASLEVLAAIEKHFQKGDTEMIKQATADPEALAEVIEI
jgi:ATP-dependent RNA helicase DDX19/DBP5